MLTALHHYVAVLQTPSQLTQRPLTWCVADCMQGVQRDLPCDAAAAGAAPDRLRSTVGAASWGLVARCPGSHTWFLETAAFQTRLSSGSRG